MSDLTDTRYWQRRREARAAAGAGRRLLDSIRRFETERVVELLRQATKWAPGSDWSVLEIGCAPGDFLQIAARAFPEARLAGVDFDSKGAEEAREKLAAVAIEAQIFVADAREFAPETRFDLVLSAGLIEHFGDPVEIVRQHARVARDGGTVLVLVPNFRTPIVREPFRRCSPDEYAAHNQRIMDVAELRRVFQAAGLEQVQVGAGGAPRLYAPAWRSANSLPWRAYALAANAWNLASGVIPSQLAPWPSVFWAVGKARG